VQKGGDGGCRRVRSGSGGGCLVVSPNDMLVCRFGPNLVMLSHPWVVWVTLIVVEVVPLWWRGCMVGELYNCNTKKNSINKCKNIKKTLTWGPNNVEHCLDPFMLSTWVLNIGC